MEPPISFDILSSFGDNVRLCEIEDDLRLYHYKECDENSNNFLSFTIFIYLFVKIVYYM